MTMKTLFMVEPTQLLYYLSIPVEIQAIHGRCGEPADPIHQRARFNHPFQDLEFLFGIKQAWLGRRFSQKPDARRQAVRAPVADAADDEMLSRNTAGHQPAAGDVAANHIPGDLA